MLHRIQLCCSHAGASPPGFSRLRCLCTWTSDQKPSCDGFRVWSGPLGTFCLLRRPFLSVASHGLWLPFPPGFVPRRWRRFSKRISFPRRAGASGSSDGDRSLISRSDQTVWEEQKLDSGLWLPPVETKEQWSAFSGAAAESIKGPAVLVSRAHQGQAEWTMWCCLIWSRALKRCWQRGPGS